MDADGPNRNVKLAKLEPLVINVSSRTNWFFVRLTTDTGVSGGGEASLNGWEPRQITFAQMLAEQMVGQPLERWVRHTRVFAHGAGGLVAASICEDFSDPDVRRKISLGLDRVFAVREAIGPDADLMVDCHWRFDEPTAAWGAA
ncbi:MAG: hypothetical protein EHM59_03760 [Betaproteobacteria bacterium]|nr:MAG: hypothetical protein EHM59_03760 [Betaproteobacteria bacterium]